MRDSVPRVRCATLGWVVQPLRGKYAPNADPRPPRVRCATLGCDIQPLRGKYAPNPDPFPGCVARPWAVVCNGLGVNPRRSRPPSPQGALRDPGLWYTTASRYRKT